MRIVGGVARGRPLHAPPGRSTRPTSDRVREAVFSMLGSLGGVEDASVLDLFAGSGALGIEALSRGAAGAIFVDSQPESVRVIGENLSVLGELGALGTVVRAEAMSYLSGVSPAGGHWDIVF